MRYRQLCQSITLAVIVFLAASGAQGQNTSARYFIQGYDNPNAASFHGTLELKPGYDYTEISLDKNGKPAKPFTDLLKLHWQLVDAVNDGGLKGAEWLYISRYEIQLTKNETAEWPDVLTRIITVLQSVAQDYGKTLEYKIPEELTRQSLACNLMHLPELRRLPKRLQPSAVEIHCVPNKELLIFTLPRRILPNKQKLESLFLRINGVIKVERLSDRRFWLEKGPAFSWRGLAGPAYAQINKHIVRRQFIQVRSLDNGPQYLYRLRQARLGGYEIYELDR